MPGITLEKLALDPSVLPDNVTTMEDGKTFETVCRNASPVLSQAEHSYSLSIRFFSYPISGTWGMCHLPSKTSKHWL
ncbi:hypothetical protein DK846_09410 [Methanospirillum lacunae]|uniref:Uncharacterized protein n=1 Tax=Methanospirillum lacunae TaxID=668570 RepID=A0A2V2N9D0_9EURY|nr:hypothetical protein DK846_09410 [Methanospirillum lacunae]